MLKRSIANIAFLATITAAGCHGAMAADFDAATATYEFAGSTFTLSGGETQTMAPSGLPDAPETPIPVGYTLAESATGDNDGTSTAVAALYRGFGANLQWLVLFAFEEKGTGFEQIAANAIYEEEAKVESLSLENGIVSIDLLVVSEADKQLPHYQQKLTEPLTLKFKIENGALVETQ